MGKTFSSLNTGTIAHQQPREWGNNPAPRLFTGVFQRAAGRLLGALLLLVLLLAATLQPSFAQDGGRQTTAAEQVDLLVFAAEEQAALVQVAWQVGQQTSNWNFAVYRSESRDFADAKPVDAPIFASSSTGSDVVYYSLSDENKDPNAYYWLVALGNENTQQVFGPYDVQQRLAFFLPLVLQNH
jgi:hypothetical protein